jgi:outer membrane autotransporter protein
VFQDTGTISVRPYLSLAQNFGKSSYGSFNVMSTTGGVFALDNSRSDFIYSGLHLDYDVANLHKIYPLIELNWIHYTGNGNARVQNFEGGDLFNYGATNVSGQNLVTLALGARYKFREWFQVGTAAEWAFGSSKNLENSRITVDFIFRY